MDLRISWRRQFIASFEGFTQYRVVLAETPTFACRSHAMGSTQPIDYGGGVLCLAKECCAWTRRARECARREGHAGSVRNAWIWFDSSRRLLATESQASSSALGKGNPSPRRTSSV